MKTRQLNEIECSGHSCSEYCHETLCAFKAFVCLNNIVLALNLLIFQMHTEKNPMTMLIACFGHVPREHLGILSSIAVHECDYYSV